MCTVEECYWLDYLSNGEANRKVYILKYGYNDIILEKTNVDHVKNRIEEHFGKKSMRYRDKHFIQTVSDHHEAIRTRIFHESGPLIITYFCTLANIVGLYNHGGGAFMFKNIGDEIVHNWSVDACARTFFVLRGAWDDNPKWLLQAEMTLMESIGIKYTSGFKNGLKNMGFVSKIISKTKTRKLREANNNIARKCGHKIGIQNYISQQHRRLPCVFDMNMIKKDETYKDHHGKYKIAELGISKEMEGFLDEDKVVSLYRLEGNVLQDKCFTTARSMFNKCEIDFSKIMLSQNEETKKKKRQRR